MSWKPIADLIAPGGAVALLGAPMEAGSVTPGRCDLAPAAIRVAMKRFSTYDVETGRELAIGLDDLGDLPLRALTPADGFALIRDACEAAVAKHKLTLLLGGNNAVTRPAAHGLGVPLGRVGLITLDAHFDMRDTDQGPMNGNPIRCLLEDGLPGANICQIGLAPFANTAKMARDAEAAGISVIPIDVVHREGILAAVDLALAALGGAEAIVVDFDIDVIDRGQCPGAPGARPDGMSAADVFYAAALLAAEPRVRLVDLTEFDPCLDLSDITALTAARWVCEILAGYSAR